MKVTDDIRDKGVQSRHKFGIRRVQQVNVTHISIVPVDQHLFKLAGSDLAFDQVPWQACYAQILQRKIAHLPAQRGSARAYAH